MFGSCNAAEGEGGLPAVAWLACSQARGRPTCTRQHLSLPWLQPRSTAWAVHNRPSRAVPRVTVLSHLKLPSVCRMLAGVLTKEVTVLDTSKRRLFCNSARSQAIQPLILHTSRGASFCNRRLVTHATTGCHRVPSVRLPVRATTCRQTHHNQSDRNASKLSSYCCGPKRTRPRSQEESPEPICGSGAACAAHGGATSSRAL